MTSDERLLYLRAVWTMFQALAHTERDWSSAEYDLACRWLAAGITLAHIERAFSEFNGIPRRLHAMEQAVDRVWEYRAYAVAGAAIVAG